MSGIINLYESSCQNIEPLLADNQACAQQFNNIMGPSIEAQNKKARESLLVAQIENVMADPRNGIRDREESKILQGSDIWDMIPVPSKEVVEGFEMPKGTTTLYWVLALLVLIATIVMGLKMYKKNSK